MAQTRLDEDAVLKTVDRDERFGGSSPSCVVFKEEKKMAYIKSVMNGMKNEIPSQQEEELDYYNHIPFFKKNDEYQEAKENGFKGTKEEYLKVRDYT